MINEQKFLDDIDLVIGKLYFKPNTKLNNIDDLHLLKDYKDFAVEILTEICELRLKQEYPEIYDIYTKNKGE